ncbi:MAG TPA: hypothetical protein VKT70_05275 [Stellaceae bacterium]|nr:hypothetical protein [Stellaceae bacterium]
MGITKIGEIAATAALFLDFGGTGHIDFPDADGRGDIDLGQEIADSPPEARRDYTHSRPRPRPRNYCASIRLAKNFSKRFDAEGFRDIFVTDGKSRRQGINP